MNILDNLEIAVLIPCHNEELTVEKVVMDAKQALPSGIVYVYDNNSTDNTVTLAKQAGAIVKSVPLKGKGNVIRRMLADIEVDIYVIIDGDDTYDISVVQKLIQTMIEGNYDMVVGKRIEAAKQQYHEIYRRGHRFGNFAFTWLIERLFGKLFTDVFSGYRVLSRRFVKSFRAESRGFEIETELTIHSLDLRIPATEIPTKYFARPEGSESKLHKFRDGWKILKSIVYFLIDTKPLLVYSVIAGILALTSIIFIIPVFFAYLHTGIVQRFPTAILSASIMLLGFMSFFCGIILSSIARIQRSMKRFSYLSIPPLSKVKE